MDRASVDWHVYDTQNESTHPVALVHSLLLSGGGRKYLPAHPSPSLRHVQAPWNYRIDGGTGLSKQSIREVGLRPLLQGIAPWAVIAIGSLILIRAGSIAI